MYQLRVFHVFVFLYWVNMNGMVTLLFLIQWILSSAEVAADRQCPSQCICAAKEAQCTGLTKPISGPFPDEVVSVAITASNFSHLGPDIFANSTENVLIEDTHLTEILSYTFANLHFLKSIRFKGVVIQSIKGYSFYNITSHAEMHFTESNINRLASKAISNMPRLELIRIDLTVVNYIESYAFYNIRVREFVIADTEIVHMDTSSFDSIYQVQTFSLSMVTINSMKARAFNNVVDIQNVNIIQCVFGELHCNALMVLREATPGSHDTFVMSDSKLQCDCLIVPMVEYILRHKNAVSDSVVCVELRATRPLSTFHIPKSCSGVNESCARVDSLIPTSSGGGGGSDGSNNRDLTGETTVTTLNADMSVRCSHSHTITLLCFAVAFIFDS